MPKENLTFTKGNPSSFSRTGDSGKRVEHLFCGNCGIALGGFTELGNFYSLAASVIEKGAELSPAMLIYTASAPDGTIFPDGVPKFDRLPPGLGEN